MFKYGVFMSSIEYIFHKNNKPNITFIPDKHKFLSNSWIIIPKSSQVDIVKINSTERRGTTTVVVLKNSLKSYIERLEKNILKTKKKVKQPVWCVMFVDKVSRPKQKGSSLWHGHFQLLVAAQLIDFMSPKY